jgi:hypothetical protein
MELSLSLSLHVCVCVCVCVLFPVMVSLEVEEEGHHTSLKGGSEPGPATVLPLTIDELEGDVLIGCTCFSIYL